MGRRKSKKDLVLDFRNTGPNKEAEVMTLDEFKKREVKKKKNKNKIAIKTGNSDYDGNLALPDEIKQREFETTGQFFRRIDRLVAKARVEANLESRFDMTLPKDKK